MSEWFKRAESHLNNAKLHYKLATSEDEEYNISIACYFLQQSIEFNIKGLIEYYCDAEFEKSHNISNNLVILEKEKDKIKNYDNISDVLLELDGNAKEISSWNSDARYNFNFVKTNALIQKVFSIAEKLSKFTTAIYEDSKIDKESFSPSLYKMELIGKSKEESYKIIRKALNDKFNDDIELDLSKPICMFGRYVYELPKIEGIVYHVYTSDNEHIKTMSFENFESAIDKIDKCTKLEDFIE